ncbi:hypothetical protein ACN47E_000279 [Coniothyrium glycines]
METIEQLGDDISALQARIATLRAHRSNLTSILLSQPNLATHLQLPTSTRDKAATTAHRLITTQQTRNLTNIYRACAGVTAYKVVDPDPNALNNGNVLGISIDVSLRGKFIETYHVLLHARGQDNAGNKVLRVHKHTIPPCIPLQQLEQKWLPGLLEKEGREQDLVRFGRALRKELVSWHLRVQAVDEMREEAKVEKKEEGAVMTAGAVLNAFVSDDEATSDTADEEEASGAHPILDIEADTAVRQITIHWSDGKNAIMSVTKDGRVEKAVCRTKAGTRDVALSRKAIGPLSSLIRRLMT